MIKNTLRKLTTISIFFLGLFYIINFTEKSAFALLMIICMMITYCILSFIRCYSLILNENLSYWHKKRDIYSIGVHFLILVLLGFFTHPLIMDIERNPSKLLKNFNKIFKNSEKLIHKTSSKKLSNPYSKGPQIFSDVFNKKWNSVNKYISDGKNFNLINEDGVGLIHSFTLMANFDSIEFLKKELLKNPDLLGKNLKPKKGKVYGIFYTENLTPIHILSTKNNSKVLIKALRIFPSGLELKTKTGETLLHYAAKSCAYKTTKTLIRKKSNINAVNMEGNSPLMLASKNKCFVVTALLVNSGANLNLKNHKGLTASEIAKEKEYEKIHFFLEFLSKEL